MKILHLSTDDIKPGAARSAYRLHRNLKSLGVDSHMLVQNKQSDDPSVTRLIRKPGVSKLVSALRLNMDTLPVKVTSRRCSGTFSVQWLPSNVNRMVSRIDPDIVNLHWVSGGYLKVEALKNINKPLVWTLRDMWPFTGGCHYSEECDLYTKSCGSCHKLDSSLDYDLSRLTWWRKYSAWKDIDLTIVALSSWIGKCAAASSLFKDKRIEVIPNGLDVQKYKPINKSLARELLKLPQDKKLILFGAVNSTTDKRKGFHLLLSALKELSQKEDSQDIEVIIFGASQQNKQIDFGFPYTYLGKLNDDLALNIVYSSADVFIAPSVQENLPNTVLESLACGTPSIAFDIGGMPDLIEHKVNGYLARPFDTSDLAYGISWILENSSRYDQLSFNSRERVEKEFNSVIQAKRYSKLFNDILLDESTAT